MQENSFSQNTGNTQKRSPLQEANFYSQLGAEELQKKMFLLEKAEHKLTHDDLVNDIFNENGFKIESEKKLNDYTERCKREGKIGFFCVAFLDGNRFKAINDTYGHDAGDDVIVAMGNALNKASRTNHEQINTRDHRKNSNDIVSRCGGDEFLVMLMPDDSRIFTEEEAKDAYEKWLQRMEKVLSEGVDIRHAGETVNIKPSLCSGAAFGNTDNKNDLKALKKEADVSMLERKKSMGPSR